MGGNSEWNKAVKIAFKNGRRTNKKYSLKEAMFDAKKIYKKINVTGKKYNKRTQHKKERRRTYRGGNYVMPDPRGGMPMMPNKMPEVV